MNKRAFFALFVLVSFYGLAPAATEGLVYCREEAGQSNIFANCTQATCTATEGGYSCSCHVQPGPSVSMNTCTQPGMSAVQSRYSPVQAYQVCPGHTAAWANCLGSPCVFSSDHKTATCNCSPGLLMPQYIVVLPTLTCDPDKCSNKIIHSSATAGGAQEMTQFLKNNHFPGFTSPKICQPSIN